MKERITKNVEMKVADFVKLYNSRHENKINRHDVYKMIKNGKLNAHKGYKNAWILNVEVEEEVEVKEPSKKKTKEYTVKEFVQAYNNRHKKVTITIPEARKLLADGILKGEKRSGKWVITSSPSRRIK